MRRTLWENKVVIDIAPEFQSMIKKSEIGKRYNEQDDFILYICFDK